MDSNIELFNEIQLSHTQNLYVDIISAENYLLEKYKINSPDYSQRFFYIHYLDKNKNKLMTIGQLTISPLRVVQRDMLKFVTYNDYQLEAISLSNYEIDSKNMICDYNKLRKGNVCLILLEYNMLYTTTNEVENIENYLKKFKI